MKRGYVLVATLLLLFAHGVFAQSDTATFPIRVLVGDDTKAPSTPTILTASAVSTDQIDITWSASTDNYFLSGYVLFRDGVAVATTTLTSYSDVGLTASTTYAYNVYAFDSSGNYSSSSNIVAATTDAEPPPPAPGEADAGGGTAARVVVRDFSIVPGVSTSTFYVETERPTRFEVRWGRTTSYELGYIVNDRLVRSYTTTLTDLEPGTVYEYEVIGYTALGSAFVIERGRFKTRIETDRLLPANVNRFQAVPQGTDVQLTWQLPQQPFSYIRIVRSHLAFPAHLRDGVVVYQGKGERVTDRDILSEYSPAYYTAFVVDEYGNVSSGAVVKVYREGTNAIPGETIPPRPPEDGYTEVQPLPPGTRMPDLSEIFIRQGAVDVSFAEAAITIDSGQSFMLFIPRAAVSENLKTIIVTLTDPTNAKLSSSFLLKINRDKSGYEAVIAPLTIEGMSRLIIDVYDYEASVVGTYQKTITFKELSHSAPVQVFSDQIMSFARSVLPLVLLPLLILMLGILSYRNKHRHREDNA